MLVALALVLVQPLRPAQTACCVPAVADDCVLHAAAVGTLLLLLFEGICLRAGCCHVL
jgi:hypothetical protein